MSIQFSTNLPVRIPSVLYLKSPSEERVNLDGKERCMISRCKRINKCALIGQYYLCTYHRGLVQNNRVPVQDNPFICYARECNRDQGLTRAHRGHFCSEHLAQLDEIRTHLNLAKAWGNFYDEVYWRKQESLLRKFSDQAHQEWLDRMEKFYGPVREPKYLHHSDSDEVTFSQEYLDHTTDETPTDAYEESSWVCYFEGYTDDTMSVY